MTATSVRADPQRETISQPLDFVSPTRLNTWLSCPLKHKLRYVDGIKAPTSPSLFLDSRVHDALHYLLSTPAKR